MRLIDGDKLQEFPVRANRCDKEHANEHFLNGIETVLEYAEQLPTVDAEVVVRCKDCKHYDMGVCLKIYSDGNAHTAAWQMRKPEDFCSYGDRRYMPRCSRGQRGPLAVCPVCGGFDTIWDPDTDESFCKSCGFSTGKDGGNAEG